MSRKLINIVARSRSNTQNGNCVWFNLCAACVSDQTRGQISSAGFFIKFDEVIFRIHSKGHFHTAAVFPCSNDVRIAFHPILIGTNSCMTALRSNFALSHLEIISNDEHHFVFAIRRQHLQRTPEASIFSSLESPVRVCYLNICIENRLLLTRFSALESALPSPPFNLRPYL